MVLMIRRAALVLALFLPLIAAACSSEPATTDAANQAGGEDTGAKDASPSADTTQPATDPAEAKMAATALNVDEEGWAVRGYDAVAYHTGGEAIAGDPAYSHDWNGAKWAFANEENRAAFAADPESYAPSNGGYCTFGVVLKRKLDVDPEVFMVDDDTLYLFLNEEVQGKFLADKDGNLALVTSQWPEIADKDPEELASDAG